MLTNANITVYNRKKINRSEVLFRANLYGVNIHGEAEIIVGDKNFKAADKYIVRIPIETECDKQYVDNKTFKALAVEEIDNCYTLQKGDIIVRGIVEDNATSRADLDEKYDTLTILSVTDNRRTGGYTSHIKLVCGV